MRVVEDDPKSVYIKSSLKFDAKTMKVLDPREFLADLKKKDKELLSPQTGSTKPSFTAKETASLNDDIIYSQTDKKKCYL